MSSDTDVKALVRERYAEVAKAAGGCCADDICGTPTQLYDSEQVDGLPSEALLASAGCGNPTAIDDLKPGDTVVDFGSGGGIDCFIAAKAVGEQGRVIGVDMTPDMVDLARRNAESLGMTNVEFHLNRDGKHAHRRRLGGRDYFQLRHQSGAGQGRGVPRGPTAS